MAERARSRTEPRVPDRVGSACAATKRGSPVDAVEERLLDNRSPFALREVEHDGYVLRLYKNAPRTLHDIFAAMASFQKQVLVIHRGRSITYAQMAARAARLARFLSQKAGIARGDHVAIDLENGPDWIAALIAITSIGATAVLIPKQGALRNCCRQTATRFALRPRNAGSLAFGRIGRNGYTTDHIFSWSRSSGEDKTLPLAPIDPDCAAIIAFTSGTTARPKAAILSHRGIVTGLQNMMFAAGLAKAGSPSPPSRPAPAPGALMLAPLAHIGGYCQVLLMMKLAGRVIFPERDEPEQILKAITRFKPTAIVGITPTKIREVLRTLSPKRYDVSSIRAINLNGIAMHPRLAQEITARLPDVAVGTSYGQTETNGAICAITGDEFRARPRSCGRIVPTVEYKIVSEEGVAQEPERIGEIWLRGAMTMSGYWGRPPLAANAGWLRTGDFGFVSADRHLHIVDRKEGRVSIGGTKVWLLEIERAVAEYDEVDEATCLTTGGVKQKLLIAAVTGRPVDPEAAARRIATAFKLAPENIRWFEVRSIPRSTNGKIDRRKLMTELKSDKRPAPSSRKLPTRLGNLHRDALLDVLRRAKDQTGVPGIAVSVIAGGKRVSACTGLAATDLGIALSPASRFEMSCLMKFFLSIVTLRLADCGTVALDMPIAETIPELGDRGINIRHLLSHSSGYRGLDITDAHVRWGMSWDRFVGYFRSTRQLFEPGRVFNYEHSEHVLLGEVLRRVTGSTARQIVRTVIFDQLGIKPGRAADDRGKRTPYVANHAHSPTTGQFTPMAMPPFGSFWDASLPDSTIALGDVARVAASLSRSELERLKEPVITLPACCRSDGRAEATPRSFGLGGAQYPDGSIGHNGSMFGQTCGLRIDPERRVCSAVGVSAWSPYARDSVLQDVLALASGRAPQNHADTNEPHAFPFAELLGDFTLKSVLGNYLGSYLGEVAVHDKNGFLTFEVGPAGPRRRSFQVGPIGSDACTIRSNTPLSIGFFHDGVTDVPNLALGVHTYRRVP